jgi:hypothetical protein
MTSTDGDPSEPPVEQAARALLDFAREEPSLVGRRGPTFSVLPPMRAIGCRLATYRTQDCEQLAASLSEAELQQHP